MSAPDKRKKEPTKQQKQREQKECAETRKGYRQDIDALQRGFPSETQATGSSMDPSQMSMLYKL